MGDVGSGTVIADKYRLDEHIGQGGMATVWRATHLSLGSSVAVKLLDVSGAKAARLRERFEREAKLAANIKHRNIVDILDFGLHDENHPYMVMELLAGESLGDRLAGETAITDAELFDIAAQVLSGLAAAHDAGIVHRDVKPDNVFLVRDADGVYPKLLDFGISRNVTPGKNDTRVTSTGVLVGTPLYMSP
ncbi:MAG: serine/threonine protein kinase, partial [Sandaracinaceae bacterium]|nr:serine/threonine protein kinase [Sandaracinaceae bacterium]